MPVPRPDPSPTQTRAAGGTPDVCDRDVLWRRDHNGPVAAADLLEEAGQRQVFVAGARRRVDQQDIQIAPGHVLDEVFDESILYRVKAEVMWDESGLYRVKAEVTCDESGLYRVKAEVTCDESGLYRVKAEVTCDESGLYRVKAEVTCDESGLYRPETEVTWLSCQWPPLAGLWLLTLFSLRGFPAK